MKVIFIHGNDSMRWSHHWAPELKEALSKFNVESIFETFPDSILARRKYWIPFLKDYLKADKDTVLIGHSSGAVCAMRFAEESKIYGSVLISPCYTDTGDEMEKQSGWYDDPWQWEKIKKNQNFIGLFYSKDDPYIPQEEFMHIKEKLSPETFEFNDRGHFMTKSFPELVKYTKGRLNEF